jgi:hypothetical protein
VLFKTFVNVLLSDIIIFRVYILDYNTGILRRPTPYGWITQSGFLLFVISLLLCWVLPNENHFDFHAHELPANTNVGITISIGNGVLSLHVDPLEMNSYQVTSDSTIPVMAEVKDQNGNILFTFNDIQPGGSAIFNTTEPCVVTAWAS